MPFMHSESSIIHDLAVPLFTVSGSQPTVDFDIKHRMCLKRLVAILTEILF